jgi:hypothetical protein
VALLWSLEPTLVGDIDRTQAILAVTAQDMTVDATCPTGVQDLSTICACGDDQTDSVPNNVYGWGQVDVGAAAQVILQDR